MLCAGSICDDFRFGGKDGFIYGVRWVGEQGKWVVCRQWL
ncbi:unnamed protein product [Prunus armeniaca]|uniref:Uncharacterized protein n=1 Tax=Prunus armeniaca TaxID=36596 RepID=A0A6J5UC90_PRUAR|nr:unnamed protein product [Prunus armeniaca]